MPAAQCLVWSAGRLAAAVHDARDSSVCSFVCRRFFVSGHILGQEKLEMMMQTHWIRGMSGALAAFNYTGRSRCVHLACKRGGASCVIDDTVAT